MYKNSNSVTNNAWTSTTTGSLNSCANCKCGKNKKSENDNEWASTTNHGDSGCKCK